MKVKTTMTKGEYEAPIEGKAPSLLIEKVGQVCTLIGGNIAEIAAEGSVVAVTFVVPDPNAALMIKNKIFYPTSKEGRWKMAELSAIQKAAGGGEIEFKDGELTIDDKKLIGFGVNPVFISESAGKEAKNPGVLYWKPARLLIPAKAA